MCQRNVDLCPSCTDPEPNFILILNLNLCEREIRKNEETDAEVLLSDACVSSVAVEKRGCRRQLGRQIAEVTK